MKVMKSLLIIYAMMYGILCSMLYAQPGDSFVPARGKLKVEGHEVTVNFSLTRNNANHLNEITQEVSGGIKVHNRGLGITLKFPSGVNVGSEPDINGEGIRYVLNNIAKDKVAAEDIQIKLKDTDPYSGVLAQQINSIAYLPILMPGPVNEYTALIKNAQLLPGGYMYSIVFKFENIIPDGTNVILSFDRYTDSNKYISANIDSEIANFSDFWDVYQAYDGITDIVSILMDGIRNFISKLNLIALSHSHFLL